MSGSPTLEELREIAQLKRIIARRRGGMSVSLLEREFLAFSAPESKVLRLESQRSYAIAGQEIAHFRAAMDALSLPGATPVTTDISGAVPGSDRYDTMIILSLGQCVQSDHAHPARSYLNPLLKEIYTKGYGLIRDFAVHEALCGIVSATSGTVLIKDIPAFPDRFTPGPYTLSVTLDTPSGTVAQYARATQLIDSIGEHIKEPSYIKTTMQAALRLRERIGPLARYKTANRTFSADASSVVNGNAYYLFTPEKMQNICVHFGPSPFTRNPDKLIVLDGDQHHKTLSELVRLGIYEPSPDVLAQRLTDLRLAYERTAREQGRPLDEELPALMKLMDRLERVQKELRTTINTGMRREYAAGLEPMLLEFLVYPATTDPIVHELLPRLSWRSALRTYHAPEQFITAFCQADPAGKSAMLKEVTSNIHFRDQQNVYVNRWLYDHHREFCENDGLTFSTQAELAQKP